MADKKLFKKSILFVGSILLLILIVLIYVFLNVNFNFGIPCVLKQIFNVYCPGCGLTRAGISILQLDFYQAFRYNAFSIILIPIIFFSLICFVWEWIFDSVSIISKIPIWIWVVVFCAFFIYGIVRNFIPWLQPIIL